MQDGMNDRQGVTTEQLAQGWRSTTPPPRPRARSCAPRASPRAGSWSVRRRQHVGVGLPLPITSATSALPYMLLAEGARIWTANPAGAAAMTRVGHARDASLSPASKNGLPSAGGSPPIEASPPFFRWPPTFEHLHQVYLGARSVLYVDGTRNFGLKRSLITTAIMAAVGIVIGPLGVSDDDRTHHTRGYQQPQTPYGVVGMNLSRR